MLVSDASAANWTTAGSNADSTTNNGTVYIADLVLLSSNFNNMSLASALPRGAAVPEPSLATMLLAMAVASWRRRVG